MTVLACVLNMELPGYAALTRPTGQMLVGRVRRFLP